MVSAPSPPGTPIPLYLAAAIGVILTAIGIWQAAIAFGPPLLLINGIATLILTVIAFARRRSDELN